MDTMSQKNVNTLALVCERYLLDKHKASISRDTLRMILPKILSQIINHFTRNPPLPHSDEINKIAMMRIKDFVVNKQRDQQRDQQQQQQQQQNQMNYQHPASHHLQIHTQSMNPLPPPIQTKGPSPSAQIKLPLPLHPSTHQYNDDVHTLASLPEVAGEEEPQWEPQEGKEQYEDDKTTKDELFIQRLRQLEQMRSSAIPLQMQQDQQLKHPADVSTSLQPNPSTVIYMPSASSFAQATPNVSVNKSKTIIINGIDRPWEYFNDRSTLTWSGQGLSQNVSLLKLRCLFLPTTVSGNTPVVIMRIEGAGGQSIETTFTNARVGAACDTWHEWQPIVDHIPMLATPWTIKLYDYSHSPLNMGKDGISIKAIDILSNGKAKLTVDEPGVASPGHVLSIKVPTYKETATCTVFSVLDNTLVVDGLSQSAVTAYNERTGSVLCNTCRQAHIVVEYTNTLPDAKN